MDKTTSKNPFICLWNATGYSLKGLHAAFRNEQAFRLEVYLAIVLIPLAIYLSNDNIERALMIASWLIVMIAELVNSALEAVVDRFGGDHHELSGRAKDIGSAVVMLAVIMSVTVWGFVLWPK